MQPLTCPIPSNINPLQSNGFLFSIAKLPSLSYFCQEANIPSLDLPSADAASPLTTIFIPGDKPSYGELSITFLIDENMENYVAIHNWMIGLGFPESHTQHTAFMSANQTSLSPTPSLAGYSDGVLQILNSANKPSRSVQFVDCFPTSLSSLSLQSTTTDTVYLAGSVTFRYTLYKFV